MQTTEIDFITLVTALIKDGRAEEAASYIWKRIGEGDKTPHLHSLAGMVRATTGDYLGAIPCFLCAYASTRNPFYLRQLEEVLPKVYTQHLPFVLNSMDFISLFRERRAPIIEVELKSVSRQFPDLKDQLADVFPSALFEEVIADRGLWIAEDKNLEILFAGDHHSLLATDTSFLLDKMHEIPPTPTDLFPGVNTAEGTLGIHSVHLGARSMLCRKSMLPTHTITEEAVYIGGSPNVGHFLLDFLPKVEIWAQSRGQRDLPIYTYNISGFCREMTDALFPEFRFVDLTTLLPQQALLRFEHVHIPSYMPAGYSFPVLKKRAERFGHTKPEDGAGDLVYLARGKAYRRIVNEEALIERLQRMGFAIIDTMETPFAKTIAIMANVRLLVGGYGAHSSYVPFCRQGIEYVELLPDVYADNASWRFNDRLYTHSHVKERKVRCPTESVSKVGQKTDFTFRCDVDAVEQVIRKSASLSGISLPDHIPLAGHERRS